MEATITWREFEKIQPSIDGYYLVVFKKIDEGKLVSDMRIAYYSSSNNNFIGHNNQLTVLWSNLPKYPIS